MHFFLFPLGFEHHGHRILSNLSLTLLMLALLAFWGLLQ